MVNIVNPVDSNSILLILQETRNTVKDILTESPQWEEPITKIIVPMLNILTASVVQLPTVNAVGQSRLVGYWEFAGGLKNKCSHCKGETYDGKPPFCSHCGAAMEEKKDVLARLQ